MGLPTTLSQSEVNEYLHARLTVLENILAELYPESYHLDFDSLTNAEIESSGLNAAAKAKVTVELLSKKEKLTKK